MIELGIKGAYLVSDTELGLWFLLGYMTCISLFFVVASILKVIKEINQKHQKYRKGLSDKDYRKYMERFK